MSSNIKINPNVHITLDAIKQEMRNVEIGFYATFSRFANLFIGNIRSVDTAKVGLSVEQHDQLQHKSLAMRKAFDPRDFGKTQDILDKYRTNGLSDEEVNDLVKLAEGVVFSKEALTSLKELVELFLKILQSLPSGAHLIGIHWTLANAFTSSAINFISSVELHVDALRSPSIEVEATATIKIFSCGKDFCGSFKQLNDFYCENRIDLLSR